MTELQPYGYLTPDDLPVEVLCLTLTIPYNHIFIAAFLGALYDLIDEANWQQFGSVTPAEAAAAALDVIDQATDAFVCNNDIDAPFWDEESGDDSDDTAPIDDQPWYGNIVIIDDRLTFVENAFIWLTAGFIAYSGAPSAAISFLPIARTFVVTMKTNPLGGIVRFLADATEIGQVDTYSAADGVSSTQLVMPAPAAGLRAEDVTYPTLWLQLLPDNPHDLPSTSMTLIRSRLSASDVTGDPTKIRYDDGCSCIQTSPDGGTTWMDNPGADPRYGVTFTKPPPGGSQPQCDGAANRIKWLRDFIETTSSELCAAAEAFVIAGVILNAWSLLFPEAGVLLDLFVEAAGTITGIGCLAFSSAFDDDEYAIIECLFFCDAAADGSYDETRFNKLVSDIDADPGLNITAKLILDLIFALQGWNGVNNAGVIGDQVGDCDTCDCGWCKEVNFASSDGGYEPLDSSLGGTYSPGIGWTYANTDPGAPGIYIVTHFTAAEFKHIEFSYSTTDTATNFAIIGTLGGVEQFRHASGAGTSGIYSWDGDGMADQIDLQMGLHSGEGAEMTHVLYQGVGDEPSDLEGDPC